MNTLQSSMTANKKRLIPNPSQAAQATSPMAGQATQAPAAPRSMLSPAAGSTAPSMAQQPATLAAPGAQPPSPNPPTLIPPPPQPAPVPGVANQSSFGPGNDLIGTQINPTDSSRLGRFRELTGNAAEDISNSPDRFALAEDRFNTIARNTNPQYEHELDSATKRAAANGRLGSGMLSNDYGTVAADRARSLDSERSRLLQDALEGTIGDRLNNLNAYRGLEGQASADEAAGRSEQRGERDYQYGLSRDAQSDELQKYLLQMQEQAQRFNQGASAVQLGLSKDPTQAFMKGSDMYGNDASDAFGSLGNLSSEQSQQDFWKRLEEMMGRGGSALPTGTRVNDPLSTGGLG